MRLVPAIIIACAIVLAPLIWIFVPMLLPAERSFDGPAVDSGARIEIEMIRGDFEVLQEGHLALQERLNALEARQAAVQAAPGPGRDLPASASGPVGVIDDYAQIVRVADRRNLNAGLTVATSRYLTEQLGAPREVLGEDCEPMTNPRLSALLVTEEVGPVRVRMLQPAIDSLRRVFGRIEATDPDLFARINTAGALCVRRIRGSMSATSSHSFGMAVDLNIDGRLDMLGDDFTQLGLTILADFFNEEGWIWGAAFGREDSMHFEVSKEKLDDWIAEGLL